MIKMNVLAPFPAGELGNVSLSYRSTGKVLTLVLTTDGTETRQGFNATYTKFYAGTNLTGVGIYLVLSNQLCLVTSCA